MYLHLKKVPERNKHSAGIEPVVKGLQGDSSTTKPFVLSIKFSSFNNLSISHFLS